jgi:hypothetical protein
MFSKTNVTLESCTQDRAKEFATMPALEGERELNPSRLAFLDGHRKAGTFSDPAWAVVIDKATGQKFRINGDHSSNMLAKCPPAEYPVGLMVTIEEYTTDDLTHDAFLLFDLFDHPRSARTNVDVMGLHRAHYPDLKAVDAKLCLALCNGIAMFEASKPKDSSGCCRSVNAAVTWRKTSIGVSSNGRRSSRARGTPGCSRSQASSPRWSRIAGATRTRPRISGVWCSQSRTLIPTTKPVSCLGRCASG